MTMSTAKKPFTPPTSHTKGGLKVETLQAVANKQPVILEEKRGRPEKTNPWWVGMEPPTAEIGDHGASATSWAYARMLFQALQGKKTLYKGGTTGHVGKKAKEIAASIERIQPGFAIEKKVQPKGDGSTSTLFVWDEGYVDLSLWEMDDEVNVSVCCTNRDLVQKILRQISNNVLPRKSLGRVYVIGSGAMGPQFFSLGVASVKMERGNYSDSTLRSYDHVVTDLGSVSPCGRLAIFDGPPGTGKTFLIRAILNAVEEAMFVLVPPEMMSMLASPQLIPMLLRKKAGGGGGGPIIFILEDADNLLTPRDSKNLSLISSLLNFSSGMLGSMLDIRAIATTNSEKKDIDAALMRPGRLCRQVTVGALSEKQALGVVRRLLRSDKAMLPDEMKGNNEITLAQAYRAARDGGWKPTGEVGDPEKKRKYGDHAADTEEPLSTSEGTVMVNSREFGEDFVIHRVNSKQDLLS
jgi:hypothetical protein